jgi:hypothetical protein
MTRKRHWLRPTGLSFEAGFSRYQSARLSRYPQGHELRWNFKLDAWKWPAPKWWRTKQAGRRSAEVWYYPRDWSCRQERVNLVNSVKHSLLIAVAILALLFGPASQAVAQSSTADELNLRPT